MTGLRPIRDGLRASARRGLAAAGMTAALAWSSVATPGVAAGPEQATFASPEEAVTALVSAARSGATREMVRILGSDGRKLVYSGDRVADKAGRERFVALYDRAHKIVETGAGRAGLDIGDEDWPFPLPLVQEGGAWRFDTKAGAEEILARRIGKNELNAIRVCRAYVDAQREYASTDRLGDGLRQYASRFMSSPGKRDGLYWPVVAGEEESPLGPLVASASAEGYSPGTTHDGRRRPYHGYYYKILTRQGKDARGGAYDYVVRGHMIGGFALVAFPARYGDSGVMTFIVNQDGLVHQKNLGPDTAKIARQMSEYNPDQTWTTP